ncbi:glycosyltransferase family 4 protein [Flavobacterium azooxidireducens]|uniref:Glycosyltransferase family 4 protein n=1 Tax=Flavobacterium azooxidireducens TaxID=1871076 RepID=A0ABY4KEP4_9FLAO|nr:glycosyltransferase family 4 protein [Flavobacterium azooxidireducens]UPQ79280.1 glycosyltransferase family 4 protein [Flavobacterium azooxidireducens]
MTKKKLIRITTVPVSLDKLLEGQLKFMQQHYEVIAVSSEKGYLEKIGKREGVTTFHLEMTRKITPLYDLLAVIKLTWFLLKTRPAIVHSHTPKAGIVGMMAAFLARVPNRFHTVAGLPLLEATGRKRKVLDWVEKLTYAFATKVYPNSKGLHDIILKYDYCKKSKLKVLANGSSNGISTIYFSNNHFSFAQKEELKNQLGIQQGDFVFVFMGRLVSDKGINELISAFKKLKINHPTAKLLLVGPLESDLDPLLPETLEAIENVKEIIAVGFQQDVRLYFSISTCLAFPSYREGFPNVVMQAGAMELPSIVSNINGCNEIIIHKENGLIIPVKDEKKLLETMSAVMEDTVLYEYLRSNARSMIVNRYEQRVVWEAMLNEYKKID